jgi:hypothetical protein
MQRRALAVQQLKGRHAMARPTYDLVLAALESHPNARLAEQRSGLTCAQVAAMAVQAMHRAPDQQGRDAILSQLLQNVDIHTSGEREFERDTSALLENLGNRDALEKQARALSEDSRAHGPYSSPERIKYLLRSMQNADLQQGIADRMRERDAKADSAHGQSPPLPPHLQHHRDDRADRRAATQAAIASADRAGLDDRPLKLSRDVSEIVEQSLPAPTSTRYLGQSIGLHETIEAAFDAHAERQEMHDPLEDASLRSASNMA